MHKLNTFKNIILNEARLENVTLAVHKLIKRIPTL
jgi:hypothetical protein